MKIDIKSIPDLAPGEVVHIDRTFRIKGTIKKGLDTAPKNPVDKDVLLALTLEALVAVEPNAVRNLIQDYNGTIQDVGAVKSIKKELPKLDLIQTIGKRAGATTQALEITEMAAS